MTAQLRLSCVVLKGSKASMRSTGSYRHLKKRKVMLSGRKVQDQEPVLLDRRLDLVHRESGRCHATGAAKE